MPESEATKHYWLYVLRLEQGKYYVGITSKKDPNARIQQHMRGYYSAQFVKKYKPIETESIVDLGKVTFREAQELENEHTQVLMKRYGLQNVRGGKFNYRDKYTKIGNRFWVRERFNAAVGVLFLLFVILVVYFHH